MEARCHEYQHDIENPLEHAEVDSLIPSYHPCYFTIHVNCREELEAMRTNEGYETKERCDSHDTLEFELGSIKRVGEDEIWNSSQGDVPNRLSELISQEFKELKSSYDDERLSKEIVDEIEGTEYRRLIYDSEGDGYEFIFLMTRAR